MRRALRLEHFELNDMSGHAAGRKLRTLTRAHAGVPDYETDPEGDALTVIASDTPALFKIIDLAISAGVVTSDRAELTRRVYTDDDSLDFGDGPFAMMPFALRDGWYMATVDAFLKKPWSGMEPNTLERTAREELALASPQFAVKVGRDDDEVTVATRSIDDLVAAAHLLGLPGLEPETGEFEETRLTPTQRPSEQGIAAPVAETS